MLQGRAFLCFLAADFANLTLIECKVTSKKQSCL